MGVMVSTVLLGADAEGTAVLAPLDAGGLVVWWSVCDPVWLASAVVRHRLCATCCHGRGPRDEYLQQSCTISVAMAMS